MTNPPVVGAPEPDHSGFGTRQQMRVEIVSLHEQLRGLEEQFDALRHAAGDFVTAYRAASMSDEEGLLMATDPDAMRQLWHRVDEAATDVELVL